MASKSSPVQKIEEIESKLNQLKTDLNNQAAKEKPSSADLFEAVEKGDAKQVRVLLERGADPTIKYNDGKTPFDLATDEKVKLLLEGAMLAKK